MITLMVLGNPHNYLGFHGHSRDAKVTPLPCLSPFTHRRYEARTVYDVYSSEIKNECVNARILLHVCTVEYNLYGVSGIVWYTKELISITVRHIT